jgi:hypothetical protein
MESKFTHYLITRFNVPIEQWDKDKGGRAVRDEAWAHERLDLFRKFCVPTILHQSNQGFKWLIYMDVETNPSDLEAIRKELELVKNAELRFAASMDGLLGDLRKILSTATTAYVITSRLDNDDGLGRAYIQQIQDAFVPGEKTLVNMLHGVLYDADQHIMTMVRNARLNHFTSLIEKRHPDQECLTVLGFSHTQPPEDCKVVNRDADFAWLKIIHGRNLNSKAKGRPVLRSTVLPFYNIAREDVPVSMVQTIRYIIRKSIQKVFR